jgi:uncharacterized spore protein YtfJ
MNVPEMLKSIGDQLQSSASAKNVYGEAVSVGDRTVIPVARVSYGFGGAAEVIKEMLGVPIRAEVEEAVTSQRRLLESSRSLQRVPASSQYRIGGRHLL